MLCPSCHFDLGTQASGLCPRCGASIPFAPADAAVSEGEIPAAPKENSQKHWLIPMGLGCVAVALALAGLLWAVRQRPPQPVQEPAPVPNVSMPTPTEKPPAPNPEPVVEPMQFQIRSLSSTQDTTAELSEPAPANANVNPAATADWVDNMRQELAQCGGFFCREKVRWKYCDKHWNSVPECAVSRNDQ